MLLCQAGGWVGPVILSENFNHHYSIFRLINIVIFNKSSQDNKYIFLFYRVFHKELYKSNSLLYNSLHAMICLVH